MLSLLPLWLAFAPPEQDYGRAVADLETITANAGQGDPREEVEQLEQAIAEVVRHPEQLPNDKPTLAQLGYARLLLAWLHIKEENHAAAVVAMDDAIRSAAGVELPTGRFGPTLTALYDERRQVLESRGTATIDVDCRVPCEVIIDEHRSPNPSDPLYLGTHRVWVGARDGTIEWRSFSVNLETPGETETLVYQAAAAAPPVVDEPDEPEKPPGLPPKPKRMLPRWAEILSLTVGAGLAVTGGVLVSVHHTCKGGGEFGDPESCPTLWVSKAQGFALLGVGAGALVISGVMLTVDEVRVAKTTGRQAMLTWTFRF
jgi:hypothetical protein